MVFDYLCVWFINCIIITVYLFSVVIVHLNMALGDVPLLVELMLLFSEGRDSMVVISSIA